MIERGFAKAGEMNDQAAKVGSGETVSAPRGPSAVDLPPASTKRWVIRRKAAVVSAVRTGVISLEEACARYHLSVEEFLSWQRMIDRHGVRGLRTTRLQEYRGNDQRSAAD